nr:phosphate regulon sensor histidine kinase PhoR [Natronospira proteinivora]
MEALRLILSVLPATLLGWLTVGAGVGFTIGLMAYTAWHLWQLYRLERWFRLDRKRNPPEGSGAWGEVFDHYYRLQQRHLNRKRRLARVLREFRNSTEAMPDGTVVLDREARIIWFNQSAQTLIGLQGNQDLGQPIGNLLRLPELGESLESEGYPEPMEVTSPLHPDRYLNLNLIPYGEGQRLLLIRDVTRLRRLERMRRDFVANASHELRSPLTVVQGYLEALSEDRKITEEWQRPIDEMQRQTQKMTAIINDMLELSRLETEAPDADRERVDVSGISARIREEALALGYGPRDVRIDVPAGSCILGAEAELYSAFSNLVFNAMRYTRADGTVWISWTQGRNGGLFSVRDNGVGIEPKHIPRLTQRFYRVDSARARKSGGTGLGLAIVKHVMQRHGGRLEIESSPGQGSCFSCRLPVNRLVTE